MQKQYATNLRRGSRQRGSTAIFFVMLMAVMASGMAATLAMQAGVDTQTIGISFKRNAAFYAAEAGIQQATWNMNYNSTWLSSLPIHGTLPNGCTYAINSLGTVNWPTSPVTFVSVGTSADGTVLSQASIMVTSVGSVPGMAIGGSLEDSGSLSVAGSVEVVGSVTRSGNMKLTNVSGSPTSSLESMSTLTSSGTFTVPGNLLFNGAMSSSGNVNVGGNAQSGGSITHSGTWDVSGSNNQDDSPDLSFTLPAVNTATLISEATSGGTVIAGGAHSNLTINFNNSPNRIVCISSNVTLSGTTTIIGSGTLVVEGTLSLSGTLGSSASPAVMNMVTTGNATLSGTYYTQGCLCVGGSLTKSGTAAIQGVMVVQSNLTGSGNITLTYAAPPSFIQFSGSGSSGNVQTTNFSGPVY
jgi:hypothetical protein